LCAVPVERTQVRSGTKTNNGGLTRWKLKLKICDSGLASRASMKSSGGGLPANYFYLLEGDPGAGKTTLALQFLFEGLRQGESVLYVTLSETRKELEAVAQSHGWKLDSIPIYELLDECGPLSPDDHYTVFHPSDVELADTTKTVLAEVERLAPKRLVIDSLAELRMLAREPGERPVRSSSKRTVVFLPSR